MLIHSDDELPLPGSGGTAVTIGAYDGVHLGHRAVIDSLARRAATADLETVVVTFDRHPAEVVRPDSAPRLLTDLDQKLELLASTGVDHAVVITFDEDRALEPAPHFVESVLRDGLRARVVVVGEDFHFGHRRQGNVVLLSDMGRTAGFDVVGHHLVGPDGRNALDDSQVSSTAIRRALVEGRVEAASGLLGRYHEMRGPVVAGDRRGRDLGFPTANVAVGERMLMPGDGIYAGWLQVDGDGPWQPSAIYVGHRPTFYDDRAAVLLEVHLLDAEIDLYDRGVAVRFVARVRDDRRFDDVEGLVAQLAEDCVTARALLAREAGSQDPRPS